MSEISYKEIAVNFLNLAASGESRKAFNLYTHKNFKHHNAYFKGDAETLMIAMEDSAKANPNKIFEIKRVLNDGNFVATHSFIQQSSEELGWAVVHIFRFEENKIIEMWDLGQSLPEEIVNENGMF